MKPVTGEFRNTLIIPELRGQADQPIRHTRSMLPPGTSHQLRILSPNLVDIPQHSQKIQPHQLCLCSEIRILERYRQGFERPLYAPGSPIQIGQNQSISLTEHILPLKQGNGVEITIVVDVQLIQAVLEPGDGGMLSLSLLKNRNCLVQLHRSGIGITKHKVTIGPKLTSCPRRLESFHQFRPTKQFLSKRCCALQCLGVTGRKIKRLPAGQGFLRLPSPLPHPCGPDSILNHGRRHPGNALSRHCHLGQISLAQLQGSQTTEFGDIGRILSHQRL